MPPIYYAMREKPQAYTTTQTVMGADRRHRFNPRLRHYHLGHAVRCDGRGFRIARNQRGLRRHHGTLVSEREADRASDQILSRDRRGRRVLGILIGPLTCRVGLLNLQ
jgi:hypothetical protein